MSFPSGQIVRGLLRMLPLRLRISGASRVFPRLPQLPENFFMDCPLAMAPGVRMDVSASDVGHQVIAMGGLYELPESRLLKKIASSVGGRMIDVGANYGYFSLLWAASKAENQVDAFEASPRNSAALRNNITKNGFGDRVRLNDFALGNQTGEARFWSGNEDQTGWGGLAAEGQAAEFVVQVKKIDDLFPQEHFTFLKIDCEGADPLVLEGAAKMLAEHRVSHILFEENLPRMQALGLSSGQGVDFVRRHGYTCALLGKLDPVVREFYAFLP